MPRRRYDEPDPADEGGRAARRLEDFEFLHGRGPDPHPAEEEDVDEADENAIESTRANGQYEDGSEPEPGSGEPPQNSERTGPPGEWPTTPGR